MLRRAMLRRSSGAPVSSHRARPGIRLSHAGGYVRAGLLQILIMAAGLRSQTPACCQSRTLRQHAMPLQPRSFGGYSQVTPS
jgi:hypothetical protein